jgi:hypothetical protein
VEKNPKIQGDLGGLPHFLSEKTTEPSHSMAQWNLEDHIPMVRAEIWVTHIQCSEFGIRTIKISNKDCREF